MTSRERVRFRLRVNLFESSPEIWRTVDVDGALRLGELHDVIQIAMGWRDEHLHEFTEVEPGPRRASRELPRTGRRPRRWMPAHDLDEARTDAGVFGEPTEELLDENDIDVASVFESIGGPLFYWYDFGDGWWHGIELIERERVDAPGASQPVWARRAELVRGERLGPFEDSGGMHGHDELLARLADADSPEHADAVGWVTDTAWPDSPQLPFDPDAFDRDAVDDELRLRFDTPSDMSGLLLGLDDDPVDERAPIVELLDRLPPPLRRVLRMRLRASGALDPVVIDAEAAARMVQPFTWLLERVGADGLTLTKAGWMPPAVVLEGMTSLGWLDDWIGTANREDMTSPIRELRATARSFGLIRLSKGRLLRTATGTKLQHDPVALWRMLAMASVERRRSDLERLATILAAVELACGGDGELQPLSAAVARGLTALGWQRRDGWHLGAGDVIDLVRPVWYALGQLGAFGHDDPHRRTWPRAPRPAVAEGRAFTRAMLGAR